MKFSNYIFIIVITCFFLSTNTTVAQQINQGDVTAQPSDLLINDLYEEGNSAYIQQIGDDNELELVQEQSNDATINLTRVLQAGDYNVAIMQQSGMDNQAVLIQDGNSNFYQLLMDGDNNNIAVLQLGNDNSIIQKLINTSQVNVELVQEGNGNEIIHILEGMSSRNFQVIQKGDNLKVEIRQSSY